MDANDLEVARRTFDERVRLNLKAARITAWCDHPYIRTHYIHPQMSGRVGVNWFGAARDKYLKVPKERGLSIGCGAGDMERTGLSWGVVHHFDAYDLSPGSIDRANMLAQEAGLAGRVNYFVADLNQQDFPRECYDVVFANQALHHIHDLEHLFAEVRQAMKPDAVFVVNEYVGPNQMQWTDKQIQHAREMFDRLDHKYITNLRTGKAKQGIYRQPISAMNAVDPTEAIRSEDIVPLLREYFEVIEQNDYGGTVINLVLEGIAGNFVTPEDHEVLRQMWETERDLIKSGELPSDHTYIVARRKQA